MNESQIDTHTYVTRQTFPIVDFRWTVLLCSRSTSSQLPFEIYEAAYEEEPEEERE
jgi:hypothetical protein